MSDIGRMRFGPTPWTCSCCGHENAMSRQYCKSCGRDPRQHDFTEESAPRELMQRLMDTNRRKREAL